jgi:CheY-like chemotaxis protein
VRPAEPAIAGQRALVADDEAPVRTLLQRLLTRRGFAVDLAMDGRMAAELLESNHYDIVLCDIQMPHLTGLALYENLHRQQPEILERFVFISGDILNPQLHTYSDSSKIPLLSKPFGSAKLDAVLDKVSARRLRRGAGGLRAH